ncbi:MAG: Type 1 glutamine amidotransferase-like domain-containing protein [Gemmatimonadota bacterium]
MRRHLQFCLTVMITLTGAASFGCAPDSTSPEPAALSSPPSAPAHVRTTAGPGVIMAAGGGSEGNQGVTTAWSYKLYSELVLNGDINGDGVVKVAILETSPQSTFMVNYFNWIGTTVGITVVAKDYLVPKKADANSAALVGGVATSDVIFIKGGDQGVYYDQWNGTLLETNIRTVANNGGGIGGTSAGAMSLSEYCFCGSMDMISTDVLRDSHTRFLDDASQPGTSGIHTDFLSFLSHLVIDSHFTERGRLGRTLGILARATEDSGIDDLLAIGIEARTGLVIRNNVANVIGIGEVSFIHQSPATVRIRDTGHPLVYTNLVMDRLTEGWRYDLNVRGIITSSLPAGVTPVTYAGNGAVNIGSLTITGSVEADKSKFAMVATYKPANYTLKPTTATTFVRNGIGFTDAGRSATRDDKQESIFRAMFDQPSFTGFLGFSGGTLTRTAAAPDEILLGGTLASIILDGKGITWRGLSPYPSNYATAGGALKAAALTNLSVNVLAESATRNMRYNSRIHSVVP